MEGDIIRTIRQNCAHFGHYHSKDEAARVSNKSTLPEILVDGQPISAPPAPFQFEK